jgi:hypothetical protein
MCLYLQLREVLEMLISYMDSKSCKTQIFLLLYEPHCAEILYCLLVERSFSMELKQKVLKVILILTQLSFDVPKEHVCPSEYYRPVGMKLTTQLHVVLR